MLGNNCIYLLYSQLSLFIWFGSLVPVYKRIGSMHIFKAFLHNYLEEQINYQPSYVVQGQNMDRIKFRIETEGYES